MTVNSFFMRERISDYSEFVLNKSHSKKPNGIKTSFMPKECFPFQKHLIEWSLDNARSAIWADCGLGKTLMELVWAQNVVESTNKKVLILTPLAVASQTVSEGDKFGIECVKSRDGSNISNITVTNYEMLKNFNPEDFSAVVCDESSILKNFNGVRKSEIIDFMKKVPYRLLATATAAPNDYIEIGNSSEALGFLGYMDMLNRFFKNDLNNSGTKRMYGEAPKWRFKGHAELSFWRWVVTWARACRKPSDLGFGDDGYNLPELIENTIIVNEDKKVSIATDLNAQRKAKRDTIFERCEKVLECVDDKDYSLIWCGLNDEGDCLEKIIPDSVQVSGKDSDQRKEEKLTAFARGEIKRLISKPKIGAWGLNFQHCNHITYFPSHSYEQYYQSVRRCWRFGQKRPVTVDIVMSKEEKAIMKNMIHKSQKADKMFENLISEMNTPETVEKIEKFTNKMEVPSWL